MICYLCRADVACRLFSSDVLLTSLERQTVALSSSRIPGEKKDMVVWGEDHRNTA